MVINTSSSKFSLITTIKLGEVIPQVDGNASFESCSSNSAPEEFFPIPSQIGLRPRKKKLTRPPQSLRVIQKSAKVAEAQSFPRITIYNARSLFPKIESLITDI